VGQARVAAVVVAKPSSAARAEPLVEEHSGAGKRRSEQFVALDPSGGGGGSSGRSSAWNCEAFELRVLGSDGKRVSWSDAHLQLLIRGRPHLGLVQLKDAGENSGCEHPVMTAERTAAASSGARNGLQAHLSPPNVAATAAKVAQAVSGGASNS